MRSDQCRERRVNNSRRSTIYANNKPNPQVNMHGEYTGNLIWAFEGACNYCGDRVDLTGITPTYDENPLPGWVYDHPDVWTNPRRQGGSPCVRGTRINVDIILNLMAGPEGMTNGQILEFYPTVSAEQLTRLRAAYEKNGELNGNS